MIALAARSNIDVVFIIAIAAVVWTLGHRSVPEPTDLKPERGDAVFAALGDSFISGEGAEEFYEGTNQPGVSTCRRAPTAYSPLLLLERLDGVPNHLRFLACSGDEIEDIPGQVDELLGGIEEPSDVEFVLLSIGGNDGLFGTVGQVCLLPIDCTDLAPAWKANLEPLVEELAALYESVRAELPGVPIYVVPYPFPIAPESCDYSIFTGSEHQFLAEFSAQVDDTVAAAVAAANDDQVEFVDTMPNALANLDLRLCDGDPGDVGVNFLAANSVIGSLEKSVNPLNWVHNSLHPNARGHEAMRAALVEWLQPRLSNGDIPTSEVPDFEVVDVAQDDGDESSECEGKLDEELESCSWDWAKRELSKVILLGNGLLLLPVAAGAWVTALSVMLLWRRVFP